VRYSSVSLCPESKTSFALGRMPNPILTWLDIKPNIQIVTAMIDYSKTKEEAQRRRSDLLARQQQIPEEKKKLDEELEQNKRELIGLDQILDGLEFMSSDVPPDFEPTGFTDKIRQILGETSVPLVPTQIRDALQARGITGSSAKNLLINVHKVLERINAELEESTTTDGKTAYRRTTAWTANSYARILSEYGRLRSIADLTAVPIDPEKLPDQVRVVVTNTLPGDHPPHKLRANPKRTFGGGLGKK
jgi:hypothetical protein